MYRIISCAKRAELDSFGMKLSKNISEANSAKSIKHKEQLSIRRAHVYIIKGLYTKKTLESIINEIIVDAPTEKVFLSALKSTWLNNVEQTFPLKLLQSLKCDYYGEVSYKPGVTDTIASSLQDAMKDLLGNKAGHAEVYAAKLYGFRFTEGFAEESLFAKTSHVKKTPASQKRKITEIISNFIANPLIERFEILSKSEIIKGKNFTLPYEKSPQTARGQGKRNKQSSFKSNGQPAYRCIDIAAMSNKALLELSTLRCLHLSLDELKAIQQHYSRKELKRERRLLGLPEHATDLELEALAQTWSEHCKHKIFAADISYTEYFRPASRASMNREKKKEAKPNKALRFKTMKIHSLYRTYIKNLTKKLARNRDDLLSVFKDNAGIIRFTKDWSVAMKVETHNSPSALDPFGGALTGITGVNRDIIGAGIGARPLFNTNVLCFARPNYDRPLPKKLLAPLRILRGVHLGIERGGNEAGIPTVNGAMVFHNRYVAKPIVYCGTGGLIESKLHGRPGESKEIPSGYVIVCVGGRVGKDGIHGATSSSAALEENSPTSMVQIGDPITQKKMTDFLMQAKAKNLYESLTDNGAGGLSSSVGEMALESGGADLYLDRVALKYPNMESWEILVSESQERMTLCVDPKKLSALQYLARLYDTELSAIGYFRGHGFFRVFKADTIIANLPLSFLHEGLPTMQIKAVWNPEYAERWKAYWPYKTKGKTKIKKTNKTKKVDKQKEGENTALQMLRSILARPNIASKENWVRRYDHEVKARTIVKPFSGAGGHGVSDAAVIKPLFKSNRGLVISNGIAPRYSDADTRVMTEASVDEALRNAVAVGADPQKIYGLDNFAWPDPIPNKQKAGENPMAEHKLAQLVRSAQALYASCLAYGIPLISGKDSMKNDYGHGAERLSVPPTLLFTALGIIEDIRLAITAPLKQAGSWLYVLGKTYAELGLSEYAYERCPDFEDSFSYGIKVKVKAKAKVKALASGSYYDEAEIKGLQTLPRLRAKTNFKLYKSLHKAMRSKTIKSCHDLSEGGLLSALSESAIGGMLGANVSFACLKECKLGNTTLAYSESFGRFLVEVPKSKQKIFENCFAKEDSMQCIGEVIAEKKLIIQGTKGESYLVANLDTLLKAWHSPLNAYA